MKNQPPNPCPLRLALWLHEQGHITNDELWRIARKESKRNLSLRPVLLGAEEDINLPKK